MVTMIIVAVVVGAAAFFGGMKYQQNKQPAFTRQFGNGQARNGGPNASGARVGNGFRPVNGAIISSDDNSITVKLTDGSSKIVLLNDKTVINKANEATKTDLTTGQQVAVFGTDNTDGSVTAQSVQLNPMQMRNFGGASQPPAASAAQ